jgi:hypothetical protein
MKLNVCQHLILSTAGELSTPQAIGRDPPQLCLLCSVRGTLRLVRYVGGRVNHHYFLICMQGKS